METLYHSQDFKLPNRIIILLFTLLFLPSCVDRIDLESSNPNQRVLIVEGNISNLPGPYEVSLSVSTSRISNQNDFAPPLPIIDAQITIIRQSDNFEEPLFHVNTIPGTYRTNANSTFQGEVGESYSLSILVDGLRFVSSNQKINDPVSIDSLYFEFNEEKDLLDLYIDFTDPSETNFYRWEWNGFREVRAILPPIETFGGEPRFQGLNCPEPFKTVECCPLCYISFFSNEIRIQDDQFINGQKLTRNLVDELIISSPNDYLVEVRLQNINKEYYEFLRLLNLQKESEGGLFDPPPFQIRGNIIGLGEAKDALGFFSATSASEKFIQFSGHSFSRSLNSFEICDDCRLFNPTADTVKPENWK